MSHFTKTTTQIKDKAALMEALRELGYEPLENERVRGFMGATTEAEIVIDPVPDTPQRLYDVGFVASPQGYEIVADWWGVSHSTGVTEADWVARLKRQYALTSSRKAMLDQGFEVVESSVGNRVRLVATRPV